MKIIQWLKFKKASRTSSGKVEYLRAQGCKIGKKNQIIVRY